MKILISDYGPLTEDDYGITAQRIQELLPEARIRILPYDIHAPEYLKALSEADGFLTGLLPVEGDLLEAMAQVRAISVSAAGYGNVDLEKAHARGILVSHIQEYCTQEVAEHTMALILALNRNLKHYQKEIEESGLWQFYSVRGGIPLSQQTLAIFGFGRIGKQVAAYAKGFNMKVLVVDPYVTEQEAQTFGVTLVNADRAFSEAHVITNHMNLTEVTKGYFNKKAFASMKNTPLFINMGRGGSVVEEALLESLNHGLVRGAGLDVLTEENPNLSNNPFAGREDVILTPHSGFYSRESMRKLQVFSAENLVYSLTGRHELVKKLV